MNKRGVELFRIMSGMENLITVRSENIHRNILDTGAVPYVPHDRIVAVSRMYRITAHSLLPEIF
ncbi:hypothetical protein D3C75_1272280 [compost metagenome]